MGSVAQLHSQGAEPDPRPGLAAVVAQVAAGDERALATLYDLTSRRVFALALQILKDRGAAEEATLDVFTQAWRQADRYDPAKGSPLGWLLNMGRTRAIDLLRSRGRHAEREATLSDAFAVLDSGDNPQDANEDADDARRVRRALVHLPAGQREALVAAYFGGLSHAEVALALGQPLGTVKTRIRSGLIHLRRLLAANGDSVS
jgi:RNA polymerase sigma-70 factor (ECF subfamily)